MEDFITDLENDMRTLQIHLADLRKLSGWTSEELALKFDVTKQNISRLEHLDNKINRFQYISLRILFEHKAKDSIYLKKSLLLLFYNPAVYRKNLVQIDSTIAELANAVYNNMEQTVKLICENIISPLLSDGADEISANKWIEKILKQKKDK